MTRGNEILKIGLVGDIHLGPDRETRRGAQAARLLTSFLDDMARFAPALIVDLGDRIMEVDEPTDRRHTIVVRDLLDAARVPVHHLLGNHDVAHVSKTDLCRLLNLPGPYRAVESGGYQLLFLDSTDPIVGEYGGRVSDGQLAWLADELSTAQRAVVFCHHPLDEQPITLNPLFHKHPEWAMVENRAVVRAVLAGRRNVAAVVSGHVHWNHTSSIEGIAFLTVQGLVETWTTHGEPAGAYGKLWIHSDGRVRLVVEGRDPLTVEMGGRRHHQKGGSEHEMVEPDSPVCGAHRHAFSAGGKRAT